LRQNTQIMLPNSFSTLSAPRHGERSQMLRIATLASPSARGIRALSGRLAPPAVGYIRDCSSAAASLAARQILVLGKPYNVDHTGLASNIVFGDGKRTSKRMHKDESLEAFEQRMQNIAATIAAEQATSNVSPASTGFITPGEMSGLREHTGAKGKPSAPSAAEMMPPPPAKRSSRSSTGGVSTSDAMPDWRNRLAGETQAFAHQVFGLLGAPKQRLPSMARPPARAPSAPFSQRGPHDGDAASSTSTRCAAAAAGATP